MSMSRRPAAGSTGSPGAPGDSFRVSVRAFARARELLGEATTEVELSPGSSVGDCLAVLAREHPRIGAALDGMLVAVNEEYAARDRQLVPGDVVALIPPVSGG